jgi:hypothetical protein
LVARGALLGAFHRQIPGDPEQAVLPWMSSVPARVVISNPSPVEARKLTSLRSRLR